MARLGDIPVIVRTIGVWELLKRIWQQVNEDNLVAWAAALAYSWLFAVFPFLVFLMTLLPYLPSSTKSAAEKEMQTMIYDYAPRQAADTIWKNVNEILHQRHVKWSIVGLALAVWGASRGVNMTISALDKCYELDRGRPMYRQIPVSIGLTIVVASLILALLVLLPIGSIVMAWVMKHGSTYLSRPMLWIWNICRYPLALLVMFSVVHVLYHWAPSIKQRFTYFSPGGVFCVAVWIALAIGFRIYVEKFGKFNESYGTVGGVVILLMAFYLDALVLLVGAEINSEIDFAVLGVPRGSRDFRTPCAVKQACPIDPKETEDKSPTPKSDGLTRLPPAADAGEIAPEPQRSTI
ncbi:MAG TPA: YihY/virulence factor BrkB family protein [Tepidisphaeraceae bacterium]|nr:YihY/virulence factor BrkB family protein [Tepidisphaeraceae bacterium]